MTARLWGLLAGVVVFGLAVWGVLTWHAGQVSDVYDSGVAFGRTEVQAQWDQATKEATEAQAAQNTAATSATATEVEVVRTVYQDRIKEVTRYVPNPDTHCPADPEFVRLFNGGAASPAGEAADQ